uniref:Cytotoxic translational repressor of toxin-antitoxin stability system n=1 Tax=Steinernema glaseri TaxID=37863 RepID=A0A1I8ASR0_9BILA
MSIDLRRDFSPLLEKDAKLNPKFQSDPREQIICGLKKAILKSKVTFISRNHLTRGPFHKCTYFSGSEKKRKWSASRIWRNSIP